MNILMIDDDVVTNFLVDILLAKSPFVTEYHIQSNAKEAIDFLSTYKSPLTCILVDVKMPEMDGFEFLEHFERHFRDKFPETQVYFLTSSARKSDESRAMKFQSVKGYILKPLSQTKLREINDALSKG
jgi:CheY-like chemotaxis protein